MRPFFLLGRALFGGYFVYNGINHFLNEKAMRRYVAEKGVAAPDAAVTGSGAMLVAGGLSVMSGFRPRRGLAAIVGFLIPATLQMHRFWEEQDPARRMAEMVYFTRNMALVGAALTMMQITEPWPTSVDESRARGEEMFIRLGGREFRALPA